MHRSRLKGSWTEDLFHLVYHQYFNIPIHTHGQDNTVAVWDMFSPMDIFLRKVLEGHTGSVYAVDFDEKYIVSGSRDKTIKVCEKGEREVGEGESGGEAERDG